MADPAAAEPAAPGAAPEAAAAEPPPTKRQLVAATIKTQWRFFFMLIWPFIAALVFIADKTPAFRCLFLALIMAGYWVTECIPTGVTGLFPIAFFPLLGIMDSKETCKQYMNDTIAIFLTSLMLAFAIEASNLHLRLALTIMLCIGTTHLLLTLGFMLVTMFVSMWIVNTAAAAMMIPVAMAVLLVLEEEKYLVVFIEKEGEEEPYPSRTTRCYMLGIFYAANIGGIGTLVGTGTNLAYKGLLEGHYTDPPNVDFLDWMIVMVPIMLVSIILSWVFLSWMYLGLLRKRGMDPLVREQKLADPETKRQVKEVAKKVVAQKLKDMGPMKFSEYVVLILFILVVILWILRDPSWGYGWAKAITNKEVKDSCPATLVVIILFMVPSTLALLHCLDSDPEKRPTKRIKGILQWDFVNAKMMWGFMLLIGGGFALAKGFDASGLSKEIGDWLRVLKVLHPYVILLIVCFVATNFTELTSNVAVANIMLPVVAQMADVLEINPIYLMLPVALCCSFTFMLPVGSPPNALAAGYGHIRTFDMIIPGIAPTIITYVATVAIFPTLGGVIYHLNTYPDWAKNRTGT